MKHMVPTETFKDSIEFITKLDYTFLIGLSATPGVIIQIRPKSYQIIFKE